MYVGSTMSINRPTNRLKALREAAGMTRKELAALVSSSYGGRRIRGEGISESTIYRWESGGAIPEKYWARLTEIFEVSASHLLGLDGEDKGHNGDGESEVA